MRIMGIDPGTAITGYSILDKEKNNLNLLDYGCITTASGLELSERLKQIADDLNTLINKWKPEHASVEKIFFNSNVKTAISVAQARGVVLHILAASGIQLKEYTPTEIKSSLCGYGRADKKMIQKMVKIVLGLSETPKPDDAADAIANAICLANSLKFK